jgi:DNA polymerase-3 subunit alpha
MVARAGQLDYPALGLTDHRTVSGAVQLYTACRKAGIEPLPGIEIDVFTDVEYAGRKDYFHLVVNAYTERGYRNLCRLATLSARNYYYKPRIDFAMLASLAEEGSLAGLAAMTGCFFGVLPQTLLRRGPGAAEQVVKALAGWFPRVYVELQNHGIIYPGAPRFGIGNDDDLVAELHAIAGRVGLPAILSTDSHYLLAEDQRLHESFKAMVSWGEDPQDAVFPGSGYHMASLADLRQYMDPPIIDAGMEGLADLYQAASVVIPELDAFTLKVPQILVNQDPQDFLEAKVMAAYQLRTEFHKDRRYLDQIRTEFDVLRAAGMASYIVMVDDVAAFMRRESIRYIARGSAAGSLVNYLLSISTVVDPIAYRLRFDRFLSANRLKPPDVDFDIEDLRRPEVIKYVMGKYCVVSIGNHTTYSVKGEDDKESGEEVSKSLLKKFKTVKEKQGVEVPDRLEDLPDADRADLDQLGRLGLMSGLSKHAAGYIMAPDEQSLADLPLAYIASSDNFVTSYDMHDIHQLGLLKMDFLSLKTLTAIEVTAELTGVDFWGGIPEHDRRTFSMISAGRTMGVFELNGKAAKWGCKKLKPKKIDDIIAAMALFRPTARDSGAQDSYLARHAGREAVPQRHPDIEAATGDTFGVLIYQESAMDIFSRLGLERDELEEMLDAVKASNKSSAGAGVAIAKIMPRIRVLAAGRGWPEDDIEWMAEVLEAYVGYSFNRAHSAVYGVVAYRAAYMRANYPVQFWTGMLQAYANGTKQSKTRESKEKEFLVEARTVDRVRILGPHVNESGVSYSYDKERHAIRKGLMAIKGIGVAHSTPIAALAPFKSLRDLGERLPSKVTGSKNLALGKPPAECGGTITALFEADALNGLE